MRRKIYGLLTTTFLLTTLALSVVYLRTDFFEFISVASILAALVLYREAVNKSRKSGRTNLLKYILTTIGFYIEFGFLVSVLLLETVPEILGYLALTSIAVCKLLNLELLHQTKESAEKFTNIYLNTILTTLGIIGYALNPYLLFYIIILLTIVNIYDIILISRAFIEQNY